MNGGSGSTGQIISTLTRVLVAPASNLKVAILLYATIAVFLLLLLVIGVMFIMSAPEDEESGSSPPEKTAPEDEESGSSPPEKTIPEDDESASTSSEEATSPPDERPPSSQSPAMRLIVRVGIAAVLMSAWLVAGHTTSDPELCRSCHWSASEHAKTDRAMDPHAGVGCVTCHESGGVINRYVTGVPFRASHVALASEGRGDDSDYGRITSRACTACHAAAVSGTLTNAKRGLKMSHAEPLAAAARCIDCHTRRNGSVGVHNAGMKPCLRCHDGVKVSSACPTCHEGTVSTAARASTASFRSEQIQDVSCGGCHEEKRECDPCHATRMPHTSEFKSGAHARAAAVDLWYNGGKACAHCHTATRRPCGRCHTKLLGKGHGVSMSTDHQSATSSRCNTCHLEFAYVATRDFCKDLCHTKAAKAASPR